MNNVFQRLMRRELGRGVYDRCSSYIQEEMKQQLTEDKRVYDEIYRKLQMFDVRMLVTKRKRLEQAFVQVFYIRKQFITKLLMLTAVLCVMYVMKPIEPVLSILEATLGVLGLKTVLDYYAHRFCYVDARMIMIYKAVLDYLCRTEGSDKTS